LSRNRRNKRDRRELIYKYSKQLKITLPITIVLICIIILSIKIYQTNQGKKEAEAFNNEIFNANIELTDEEKEILQNEAKKDVFLRITAVGDVLCESEILNSVKNKDYDFSDVFSNINKYISASDLTIVPIETNFVNQNYSGTINYNSPKTLAQEIKNIGGDIALLANNHAMDYGINGIKETSNNLKELGLETVGLKSAEEEQRILIKEYRNIKLAILSYTYGTNTKENDYEKYINITNKDVIENDISKAKEQGAEYIIAGMHWGNAVGSKLNKEQKELAEFLVNSGVDIILGNHPSSIQKMETKVNSEGEDVLVVYSLGNLISSETYQNSNLGMILNIELVKLAEDGKVYLNKVTYIPTYIQDSGVSSENRYQILDIKKEIENYENGTQNIDEKTYQKLKDGLVKIKELING